MILKRKIFYDTPDNFEKLLEAKNDIWKINQINNYPSSENSIPADIFPHVYFYTKWEGYNYIHCGSEHKKWIDEYSNGKIPENLVINPAKKFFQCVFEIIDNQCNDFLASAYDIYNMKPYVIWKNSLLNIEFQNMSSGFTYDHRDNDSPTMILHPVKNLMNKKCSTTIFTFPKKFIKHTDKFYKYYRKDITDSDISIDLPSLSSFLVAEYSSIFVDFCTTLLIIDKIKNPTKDFLTNNKTNQLGTNEYNELQTRLKYLENDLLVSNYLDGLNYVKTLSEKNSDSIDIL